MKKQLWVWVLGILICVFLLASLFSCGKSDGDTSNFLFEPFEDGYAVIGYKGDNTNIEIPSKHKGHPVVKIATEAFYYHVSLKSIQIPSSVTSIGNEAFSGCSSLTSITIPESVTSIGEYAFYGCDKLVEVINHSSLEIVAGDSSYGYVAYYAKEVHTGESKIQNQNGYLFYTVDGIHYLLGYIGEEKMLTLPESYLGEAYEINEYAFESCSCLESITIPSSFTSIGKRAFYGCSSLTSVKIPSSVTIIGSEAFSKCTSLSNITIPNSVTAIGVEAFSGCSSLTSIKVPNSVTLIGPYAFSGCSSLKSITFANPNTWYRATSSSFTNGTETDVTNPQANATYFKSTYYSYYWYKE